MRRLSIPVLLVIGLCLAACGGSDASDQIHGTWKLADGDIYLVLDANGEWGGRQGVEGSDFDWGTYTFEDGVLTQVNAEGSYCEGGTLVTNVSFGESGDELHSDFVSDTCEKATARKVDQVWVRYTP